MKQRKKKVKRMWYPGNQGNNVISGGWSEHPYQVTLAG
jgi:hypothetical protein